MYLKLDLLTIVSLASFGRIATSKLISYPFLPFDFKYCKRGLMGFGLSTLKGSRASRVTIQGDIDEAKLFAKNGPKCTYSHFWMFLADQSLKRTNPKMYSSASLTGIDSPKSLASVVIKAISNSKSINLDGPKTGSLAPSGKV